MNDEIVTRYSTSCYRDGQLRVSHLVRSVRSDAPTAESYGRQFREILSMEYPHSEGRARSSDSSLSVDHS